MQQSNLMSMNRSPLFMLWRSANEESRLFFLRELAIPFPANSPVESAKQALLNLMEDELQEVLDWMSENHWLPPGC
jgi:hypothetical protein